MARLWHSAAAMATFSSIRRIAAAIAAGLCLIVYGAVMHMGSEPSRSTLSIAEPAPDRAIAPPPRDAARVASAPAAVPVATTGSHPKTPAKPVVKRTVKRTVRRAAPAAAVRERPSKRGGLLDRPPLRWLRNAFMPRSKAL